MWYAPTTTIQPTTEPISPQKAKRHCWIDHDDDDDLISDYIIAARDHAEDYCGAKLAPRTVSALATEWHDLARLPALPATSVVSVSYVDADGATQTLADTVYELRGDSIALKYGQSWPAKREGSLVTVVFVAGFETCAPAIKHAMLLWIGEAYKTREPAALVGMSTMDALLSNHRFYP